jgi:translocation and assembly module TamB
MTKWLNLKNLIIVIVVALLAATITILKPKAEQKLKKIIAVEVLKFEDIKDFKLKDIKIGFFPPHLAFQEVELLLTKYPEIKKAKVEELKVYPELIRLLGFNLKLKDLIVKGLNLEIEDSGKDNKKPDFKFNYTDLENLPFRIFYIENANIKYNSLNSEIGYFQIRKKWNHFEVHSDLNKIKINEEIPMIRINRLSLEIQEKKTQLKQLNLISEDSNLQLGFEIKKPFSEKLLNLNIIESTDVRLSSKLNLSNFKFLIEKYLKFKIKTLSGKAQILMFKSAKNKKDEVEITLEAENLKYNNYFLENISTNGKLKPDSFFANYIHIQNKNLNLKTKKFNLTRQNEVVSVSSEGEANGFELGGFLRENISIPEIPLIMPGEFKYKCNGPIVPSLELTCEIDGEIKKVHIWTDSNRIKETTIVELSPSKIKGTAIIHDKYMSFNSYHEFKNSNVGFNGNVDYEKGYTINYTSDFFNFSDIVSLANIPLEGFGNASGQAIGSSRWGEFSVRTDLSNFSFFKYNLGQVVGDASYKKQKIFFQNARSNIGESLILADVGFDLKTSRISARASSKNVTVQDLLYCIKEIAVPPIYLSGEGELDVVADGPLNLGEMTYDIRGKFKEGLIYKDRYKNLDLNITAVEGEVVTQNSLIYLGDKINIEGTANPDGMVDIIAIGDSVNLSRINAIKDLGLQLSGLSQIQVHFTDFILLPDVKGTLKSANVADDYQQIGNSDFNFVIHKNYSEISGQLFNSTLQGDAKIPHSVDGPFEMKMNLNKLDPFKFMSLFESKISKVGSNTEVTGRVDINAPIFQLDKMNGEIAINDVLFRAERNTLKLKKPSILKITNGIFSGVIDFIDNQTNEIFVSLSEASNSIDGKISLGFLRTLLPQVEEIQGEVELNTKFVFQPEFKFTEGRGHIRNLSMKVENLVHSFKDIFSDLQFGQKNIYLQNLKGSFANGVINGEGKVYFTQKGIGVDLSGGAERLNLNIPEDVKTLVSGNYYFKGDGFPYLLGGDFKVLEGLFEMEFESSESAQFVVLPSPLLPKSKSVVSPLDLNLNLESKKPIVINNAYIDGSATATLNVQGQPSLPILKGQIRLTNDSKVIFQDNRFNVNSGVITFNSVSPEQGSINVDANARIKDYVDILEKEYDIRMLIQGTGANPEISFSSQPSLSEPQILSFLALGMMDSNGLNQEISLGDQQTQTGYQIGGIFLKNKFAKDIQDKLGVQFNFTSSYENQDVSPKIVIQKKFNSKFSLSGSRTLGTFQKNTARGEYKINKKLSIIGLYENYDLDYDTSLNRTRLVNGENVWGMDLQYNFEFQ